MRHGHHDDVEAPVYFPFEQSIQILATNTHSFNCTHILPVKVRIYNLWITTKCCRCAMLCTCVWTSRNHCAPAQAGTVTPVRQAPTRTICILQNLSQTLEGRSVTSTYTSTNICDTNTYHPQIIMHNNTSKNIRGTPLACKVMISL